jgi:cytosine/uracil/thiamine/allantoin permease
MLDSIIPYLEQHAWEIATISIAPLIGFIIADAFKRWFIQEKPKKIRRKILMLINAFVTGMFAFWTWPGSLESAIKVSVCLAMVGPFIVWVWFSAASKWSPKTISALSGVDVNDDWQDITYFSKDISNEECEKK